MIIKCKKEILINNIKKILGTIPKRSISEYSKCIKLEVSNNNLSLIGINTIFGVQISNIETEVIEYGSICVNAKKLFNIIKEMPDKDILISTNENCIVNIESDDIKFQILGYDKYDNVNLKFIDKKNKIISLSGTIFKEMIKKTKFATKKENDNSTLRNLFFDISDKYLKIYGTDGYRLAFIQNLVKCTDNVKFISPFIVPIETLNEIIKIIPNKKDCIIDFYLQGKTIMFEFENYKIVSCLIEGEFLNFNKIFNIEYETKIKINRIKFLNSLKRTMAISNKNLKKIVQLYISNDNILKIVSKTDVGESCENIEIDFIGNELEIAFNTEHLIDALKKINDDFICFKFSSKLTPSLLRPIYDNNYQNIIVRIKQKG